MNNIGFKKFIATSASKLPLLEDLKDFNLVLLTGAGTIIGYPVSVDDTDVTAQDLAKTFNHFANEYKNETNIDKDELLPQNDGMIYLKNVTVNNGLRTVHLPFLSVFFEDVIGITIGQF